MTAGASDEASHFGVQRLEPMGQRLLVDRSMSRPQGTISNLFASPSCSLVTIISSPAWKSFSRARARFSTDIVVLLPKTISSGDAALINVAVACGASDKTRFVETVDTE